MGDATTIAVVGVAVVMAALTILMIAIMVITRFAPGGKETTTNTVPEDAEEEGGEKERVAAIAAALTLATGNTETYLTGGGTQDTAPGRVASRWATAGRQRLMQSRRKTGRKWGGSSK